MRRLSAYRVFLTRKSEYHVRGHMCFGVRDRRTGQWQARHWALGQRLATAFPDAHGKLCRFGVPVIGEPLCFVVVSGPQYTSPVMAVEEREHLDMSRRLRSQRAATCTRRSRAAARARSARRTDCRDARAHGTPCRRAPLAAACSRSRATVPAATAVTLMLALSAGPYERWMPSANCSDSTCSPGVSASRGFGLTFAEVQVLIVLRHGHAGGDRFGVDQDVVMAAAGFDRARRLHRDVSVPIFTGTETLPFSSGPSIFAPSAGSRNETFAPAGTAGNAAGGGSAVGVGLASGDRRRRAAVRGAVSVSDGFDPHAQSASAAKRDGECASRHGRLAPRPRIVHRSRGRASASGRAYALARNRSSRATRSMCTCERKSAIFAFSCGTACAP